MNVSVKNEAINLISRLPDEISWNDIMYEIYVRNKIELGLKDIAEGKTVSHDEIKKRFNNK